jgi:hypothetical protein
VYDVASYKNLYVVSERARNSVLVIDEHSKVQKVIGGIGSGPGRLFRPGYLDVASDGAIYVQDGGNERIQSFDLDGRYLGGFATTQFMGFAAGAGGEVYLGQPEKGNLITVYSRDGKVLRSFGELKTLSGVYGPEYASQNELYRHAINRVRLTVEDDGSILVSFALAPILQKYTRQGELLFERRLEGPGLARSRRRAVADRQGTGARSFQTHDGAGRRLRGWAGREQPEGGPRLFETDSHLARRSARPGARQQTADRLRRQTRRRPKRRSWSCASATC